MADELKKKLPSPEQADNLVKLGVMDAQTRDHISRLHNDDMTDNEKTAIDQMLTKNSTSVDDRSPQPIQPQEPKQPASASAPLGDPQQPGNPTGELPRINPPTQPVQQTPQQMIDSGFGLQQAGVATAANAQSAGAAQAAKIFAEQANQQQQHIQQLQNMQKQMEDAKQQHAIAQKKNDDDIVAAKPQDFWADKSTGTRMLAGISVALGALGASLTGGRNTALDVLNSTIERDAQLQRDKYNMAVQRGQRVDSRFAEAMRVYGDQATAMSAIMAQNTAMAQTKIQQIAQQTNSQEVKANAVKIIGQLDVQRGEIYQNSAAQKMKFQQEMAPRKVPSEDQYAPTPEAAKVINDSAGDLQTAMHHLSALEDISKQSFKSLSPKAREEAQVHANMLIGLVGKGLLDGANPKVTERFQKLMEQTIANPTSLTSRDSTVLSSLHLVRESMKIKHNNLLRANGLRPTAPSVEERK